MGLAEPALPRETLLLERATLLPLSLTVMSPAVPEQRGAPSPQSEGRLRSLCSLLALSVPVLPGPATHSEEQGLAHVSPKEVTLARNEGMVSEGPPQVALGRSRGPIHL